MIHFLGLGSEKVSLQSVRYMNNGTRGHDRWEKWLTTAKLLKSSEQGVKKPELNISGRYDFVVHHPDRPNGLLIELKTTGKKPTTPHDDHLAQWAYYSERTGVEEGFIVYELRDKLEPIYFPVHRKGNDVSVFSPKGKLKKSYNNYIGLMYENVQFAQWCANNGYFPKKRCPECIQWGCKAPDYCDQFEQERRQITREEWREMMGTNGEAEAE